MLGARDLSIVSTPPKNRQPVETIITDYDTSLIQSAILREIKREGQVFFLHNRIASLEEILNTLRELVPSARIVYAHGQLPAKELEKIMMDFMQKEVDVLISTTIIGSGLDISNANTIISTGLICSGFPTFTSYAEEWDEVIEKHTASW